MTCPTCGRENAADARFCQACGSALGPAEPEARKVVTVLFTDIAGSTALGERLDPELLRRVMWRYFETVQAVLERHGGTVEKFIGDAVMAVFGVPLVHEDDPLRAARAAAELAPALEQLNDELEREHGVRIAVRTGINTGEVIVGGGSGNQRLATGDAVNVAARLEQAAAPGEVLLGAATYAMLGDAAVAEPAPAVHARGKSEPLAAHRLLGLRPDVPAFSRSIATPFVGRHRELHELHRAFDAAVAARSGALATVVGTPGIGKSRLARELVGSLETLARVVVGRCVAYGEGIPYLPLADIVREVAGDDPETQLAQLLAPVARGDVAARLVAGAVGAREGGGSPEETAWAFGRLFETLAATRPLVVVIDDIHWAEPALLDLIEYVVAFSSAPIFVLCLARPDLIDLRPAWAAPRTGATMLALNPLGTAESDELVEGLLTEHELPSEARRRIVETAEGNPLFVEQMLAMLADDPGAVGNAVPATIQALLAARIDRLEPEERAVVQRASVEGRLFHRGAVSELLEDGAGIGGTLLTLARKEFVRPDRSLFAGDDGFRFNHVLIRDVAYASVPKELRADLHGRLAAWLRRRGDVTLVGHDEIVGYHLEHAYLLRAELGRIDAETRMLAIEGGHLLGRAGHAALDRGEPASATGLLERASRLLEVAPGERLGLLPDLGRALRERGSLEAADRVLGEAIALAKQAGDELAEIRAQIERGHLAFMLGTVDPAELRSTAQRAIEFYERRGDDAGLSDAFQLMGTAELAALDRSTQLIALRQAREHAIASGDIRRQIAAWNEVGGSMLFGRTPIGEVKTFVDEELAWAREHGLPAVEADALLGGPYVDARLGDFAMAREKLERSKSICRELGIAYGLAEAHMAGGWLEVLAGDLAAAEAEFRGAIQIAGQMGAEHYVASYGLYLSRILLDQGRHDEAADLLQATEELYGDSAAWKVGRARVLAARGDVEGAATLARTAIEENADQDNVTRRAELLVELAEVLVAGGDRSGAAAALAEAIALDEEKGNVVAAQQDRERLAALERDG